MNTHPNPEDESMARRSDHSREEIREMALSAAERDRLRRYQTVQELEQELQAMVDLLIEEKIEAAKRMQRGMDVIRTHRVRNAAAVELDVELDVAADLRKQLIDVDLDKAIAHGLEHHQPARHVSGSPAGAAPVFVRIHQAAFVFNVFYAVKGGKHDVVVG